MEAWVGGEGRYTDFLGGGRFKNIKKWMRSYQVRMCGLLGRGRGAKQEGNRRGCGAQEALNCLLILLWGKSWRGLGSWWAQS